MPARLVLVACLLAAPAAMAQNNTGRVAFETRLAQAQAWHATGSWYPTAIALTGVNNARASRANIEMHTGLAPLAVRGTYFHEHGHKDLGHLSWRRGLPTRVAEREADQYSGYLLAKTGQAFTFHHYGWQWMAALGAGGNHNTPLQRMIFINQGVLAGLYGL